MNGWIDGFATNWFGRHTETPPTLQSPLLSPPLRLAIEKELVIKLGTRLFSTKFGTSARVQPMPSGGAAALR